MELGYEKGDICFRDGCMGVIDANEKEGSCSCHIHPPCGYCTTQTEYCETCGWDAYSEFIELEAEQIRATNYSYYNKEAEKFRIQQEEFMANFNSENIFESLDYRRNAHTHFSMEVYGWFPLEMSKEELLQKIKGTFGGRFTRYDNKVGRFKYIAYTD